MDTKERKRPAEPVSQRKRSGTAPDRREEAPRTSQPRRTARSAKPQPVKGTPDVIYLAPKPFSRNRLILRLTTVAAVVIALVLGLSVFFKVENIYVSGTEKYSAWDIQQAAGIQPGDNLMTFNRAKAAGKIISALPYVKSVRIGINLPGTVNIEIEEVEVTYAIAADDNGTWLISSTGKVVEKAPDAGENRYTVIQGISLTKPQVGQQAVALEPQRVETDTTPVTVTAQERLRAALDVAGFLELNGIYGTMRSIDTGDLSAIRLVWNDNYDVNLGSGTDLNRKISFMKAAMEQYDGFDRGTLDVSDPDQIIFRNRGEE